VKVTVFDYGAGNLHSLVKALAGDGRTVAIDANPRSAIDTDVLVLPGVGAFGPAAAALEPGRREMREALATGLPCLGICLGLHLLCDASDEGAGDGLGIFPGRVTRLVAERVPQIGWNRLDETSDPMLTGLATAYYANGYAARISDPALVVSWSTHERDRFPAAVRRGRVLGVQFHPEKSSAPGLRFVHRFLAEAMP